MINQPIRKPNLRALTVRQPWAWAIFHAGKDIENRSWRNKYSIGTIAIHASGNADSIDALPARVRRPEADALVRGAIIGLVDVVRIVERSRSRWFNGPLGWVLTNPRRLSKPIACTGRLGLWPLTRVLERRVEDQLGRQRTTRT